MSAKKWMIRVVAVVTLTLFGGVAYAQQEATTQQQDPARQTPSAQDDEHDCPHDR